jgi:transcriptional regulator with XRE-family HTH domain
MATVKRETLRNARSRRGWSIAETATRANLSRPYVWRLEKGLRKPSYDALMALERVFDAPLRFGAKAQLPKTAEKRRTA